MVSKPRLVTAEELLDMPDDGFRYELVRGELRKYPYCGFRHGIVAANVAYSIYKHIAEDFGDVVAATGFILERDPDHVRAPDVSFVRGERVKAMGVGDGYFPGPPDLAVEVVERGDHYVEVQEKVYDLLTAGTGMVLVADSVNHLVVVHLPNNGISVLTEQDTLDGDGIISGWSMPVADIFA